MVARSPNPVWVPDHTDIIFERSTMWDVLSTNLFVLSTNLYVLSTNSQVLSTKIYIICQLEFIIHQLAGDTTSVRPGLNIRVFNTST